MNCSSRLKPIAMIAVTATVVCLAMTGPGLAQAGGIENALQNIVNALQGNAIRLLATIAVIVVGIAWMFGYMDLRKAGFAILGIGIIFGASEIVDTISGG